MSKIKKDRLLIAEDESDVMLLYIELLGELYDIDTAYNGLEAIEFAKKYSYKVIVLDIKMPGMDGISALKKIKKSNPDANIIFISAFGENEDYIMQCKSLGYEILDKSVGNKNIKLKIKKLFEEADNSKKNKKYFKAGSDKDSLNTINQIEKFIAKSETNVLICGDSGTGKEYIANLIHSNSNRKDHEFITINCGAISPNLFETEFFGSKKGAYTGSTIDTKGKFEEADKGTIFLDEIADLPLDMQVKLLRVLNNGTFYPVGSNKEVKVDVRIISATNKDIAKEINAGSFREDLYYRLEDFIISLKPLKESKSNIITFINYFIKIFSKENSKIIDKIDDDAMKILLKYNFPGNIRQLASTIRRAVILSEKNRIIAENISFGLVTGDTKESNECEKNYFNLEWNDAKTEFQNNYLKYHLSNENGNKQAVSKKTGLTTQRIGVIMKQWDEE